MMDPTLATVTRHAASITRRGSLLTLTSPVLVAALARTTTGEAKKRKKSKKHLKRCRKQTTACQDSMKAVCDLIPECVLEDVLPCCSPLSKCQAGESIACAWDYLSAL